MNKIIFIIGMSGAGKTAWGERLAGFWGVPFFDIDRHVEAAKGKSVSQIFLECGEAGFRSLESEALRSIVHQQAPPFVLSCGGGTPVDPANLTLMKEHGLLVYLRASVTTILHNLQDHIAARPMLTNGVISPAVRISELFEKRRKIYEQAQVTVDAEGLTVEELAASIGFPVVS